MDREIAKLNFEGKLKTAVEEPGDVSQELDFGPWQASVRFRLSATRRPPAAGHARHNGRALVAQLGPDEFLVTGAWMQALPSTFPAACPACACRSCAQKRARMRTEHGT